MSLLKERFTFFPPRMASSSKVVSWCVRVRHEKFLFLINQGIHADESSRSSTGGQY